MDTGCSKQQSVRLWRAQQIRAWFDGVSPSISLIGPVHADQQLNPQLLRLASKAWGELGWDVLLLRDGAYYSEPLVGNIRWLDLKELGTCSSGLSLRTLWTGIEPLACGEYVVWCDDVSAVFFPCLGSATAAASAQLRGTRFVLMDRRAVKLKGEKRLAEGPATSRLAEGNSGECDRQLPVTFAVYRKGTFADSVGLDGTPASAHAICRAATASDIALVDVSHDVFVYRAALGRPLKAPQAIAPSDFAGEPPVHVTHRLHDGCLAKLLGRELTPEANGSSSKPPCAVSAARPVLSLCLIMRDNAKILGECLESVRPWVDEMVVVDTGSADRSREIARGLGAQVYEYAWCDDFSAARNVSLAHARGQWLFWMDTDDVISAENGKRLRELARQDHPADVLGYVIQVHCPGPRHPQETDITAVDHVKLIRNLPALRFEGRIHEQILPSIRRLGGRVLWTDIYVLHTHGARSEADRQKKAKRDLRLLHLELRERPDHPFTLFNLGMTYADLEVYPKAIDALSRSILVGDPHDSQVRKSYALLASCWTALERFETALRVLEAGLKRFAQDTELHFRRGIALQHLGRPAEAIKAYQAALSRGQERTFSSMDVGIGGFKCRHNLAILHREAGELDDARAQWEAAVGEEPRFRSGWRGLVELALQQERFADLEKLVQSMEQVPGLDAEAQVARAELRWSQGDREEALQTIERAQERFGEDPVVLRCYSRLLFEKQDWNAARRTLEHLRQVVPDDASVHHNLAIVCRELGDVSATTEACLKALQLDPRRMATRTLLSEIQPDAVRVLPATATRRKGVDHGDSPVGDVSR